MSHCIWTVAFIPKKNKCLHATDELEGCRAIVASRTDWERPLWVESQGPSTRSNRAIRNIVNHLSAPLTASGGPSVPGMRGSSSKGGGWTKPGQVLLLRLCCEVHAQNIIGTWLIWKSLLETTNQVHQLVNLNEISFGILFSVPEACIQLDYYMLPVPYDHVSTKLC